MTAAIQRVVGLGVAGWNAGTDLFLDVARRVADDPSVHAELWWVGRRSSGAARWLDRDAELCGVAHHLRWVPGTELVLDEPASVVCVVPARDAEDRDRALEQVSGRSPVVSFALPGAPGPHGDRVDAVSFPDTRAMADRVRALLDRTAAP